MKQYIGTKRIHAKPMTRGEYNEYRGWPIPADESTADAGYLVCYSDGYESWSPKVVFEAAYRETDGLSFGLAIEAAKLGKRIARAGWNGKNQYVELGSEFQYTTIASDIPRSVGVQHTDIGSAALVFVGTRGRQVGWLASQADMLADDWHIVE